jgi:hypothetical protein
MAGLRANLKATKGRGNNTWGHDKRRTVGENDIVVVIDWMSHGGKGMRVELCGAAGGCSSSGDAVVVAEGIGRDRVCSRLALCVENERSRESLKHELWRKGGRRKNLTVGGGIYSGLL